MTLTISAADLATVRRRTGDTVATYAISDAEMDAIYTSAALGNRNVNRTTLYALYDLYGLALSLVDKSNEVDNFSISNSQKFDHLEKAIAFWGRVAGVSFEGVTFGATSTYTYRADSLQAEEPTYARGTATLGYDDDVE